MTNIEELKAKYPGVEIYTLTVINRQGKPITVYLREMDRLAYKVVSALIAKDELQGVESFLRTLCVDGDVNAIVNDFKALRSAARTILPMLESEAGELKKN
jgi:collagenase-like PrtC family protease